MKTVPMTLLALLLVLGPGIGQAQVTRAADLTDHIDALIAEMPVTRGGGDYVPPDPASRILWRAIIDHILAGEYAAAHTKALTRSYQVVLFTDTGCDDPVDHVVLERAPESTSDFWGTFVFNTSPRRPHLVIQCPHPRFDLNTGYQGIRIYQHTGGKAFFVAGTHRCNGRGVSPCDGTTSVCGGENEAYRDSDQAHTTASTFQVTTEAMLDSDPALLVIQPHGFAQRDSDPDLIMSNGTRFAPTGMDFVVAVRDAIQGIDPSLTARVPHVDRSWTRLIATSNSQGRLLNHSPDPCGTAADSASGGFVHVEQARAGLRDTPVNWMKLAEAIAIAVPVEASTRED